MLGYFKNKEETNKVLQKHEDDKIWVHTGDLGYIDEDGFIWVTDRIKNMIIRHDGFKVFPSKIEEIINTHYAVEQSKVVGIKDTKYLQGELPKAHVKLKAEYTGQEDKIIDEILILCKSNLADYAIPCKTKTRERFPLTSIGKIDTITLQKEDNKKNRTLIFKRL